MQLNKNTTSGKWLSKNMPYLLEESVWSATNADYAVFVPIENPKEGLYKQDMKGVKHLEYIKMVQENWVNPGTNEKYCLKPWLRNSVSCTVIVDDIDEITKYIYNNESSFKAVSFISDYGDKAFSQAPFTSVGSMEDIIKQYGLGAMFASGLIVDGLHYFDNNLWKACESVTDKTIPITGTREQVMLRKSWVRRAKKFSRSFFNGDLEKAIFCLKDVHLLHKWEVINRDFKSVDFSKILDKPTYKSVNEFAAVACSGNSCEIVRI